MQRKKRLVALLAAAVCALAGTAAGISQSSAAKSSAKARHSTQSAAGGGMGAGGGPPNGGGPGGGRGPGGPGGAVHSVEAVLNKAGTAYISETTDSGTVTAVDTTAATVTIEEGNRSVTYGKPTITIPSDATVTLDGKSSSLSKLASGDHVWVSSSSDGTSVFATDSSFKPSGGAPGGGMGGPMGGQPPGMKPSGSPSGSTSSGSTSSGSSE